MPLDLQKLLETWVGVGWLRPLDAAFAGFLKDLAPQSADVILLMAALASHQLGRGHICLDLETLLQDPESTLAFPPADFDSQPTQMVSPDFIKDMNLPELIPQMKQSPLIAQGAGNTPMVLAMDRLYLRRYWRYVQYVAHDILERLDREFSVPEDLERRLDAFFDPLRSPEEKTKVRTDWQSVAAAVAAKGAFTVISGGPGTGKTTTVVHLLALLVQMNLEKGHRLRIRMAAPTGKAAARLTESLSAAMNHLPPPIQENLPREITTLHRLLGSRTHTRHFMHDENNPLHVDLLVVDEASMMDLEVMAALLRALPKASRLVLVGDKDQLASVEAGAVLGDICGFREATGYSAKTVEWIRQSTGYHLSDHTGNGGPLDQHIILLRKNHRFGEKSGIGALAAAVNKGDADAVEHIWQKGYRDIHRLSLKDLNDRSFSRLILGAQPAPSANDPVNPQSAIRNPQSNRGFQTYLEQVKSGPSKQSQEAWLQRIMDDYGAFRLLAPHRTGPWGVEALNEKTAQVLYTHGLIRAKEGWYAGRPVMITRNDYDLGLMNGDTGIVVPVPDEENPTEIPLKAVFRTSKGVLKKVSPSRLNYVETAYAVTVHKSQGSEFDHTVLVLPNRMTPVLTRELLYTAITRSRRRFTLVSPHREILTKAVKQKTVRASGLGGLLRSQEHL